MSFSCLPFRRSWSSPLFLLAGAVIGSLLGGVLADLSGRKRVVWVTSFLFVLGSIFLEWCQTYIQLIVGRVVVGIAIGASSLTVPIYLSEIAPPAKRGLIVSVQELCITIGIFAAFVVAWLLSGSASWRLM